MDKRINSIKKETLSICFLAGTGTAIQSVAISYLEEETGKRYWSTVMIKEDGKLEISCYLNDITQRNIEVAKKAEIQIKEETLKILLEKSFITKEKHSEILKNL